MTVTDGQCSPLNIHLFVYGTLRRALRRPEASLLDGAEWLGEGTVTGRLLDLGAYPGLVSGSGRVRGEVYRLSRPKLMLRRLDAYEGCRRRGLQPDEYRREMTRVRLDGGRTVRAWIYVYNRVASGRRLAVSDYACAGGRVRSPR